MADMAQWIERRVKDFMRNCPENSLNNGSDEQAWAEPLVGFAQGGDPLFDAYREHVGPFHLTPLELFQKTFPSLNLSADELTVISWILPVEERIKSDNRQEHLYPSERWARSRTFGEEANLKLRHYLVASLAEAGYEALSPQLTPYWERIDSDKYGFASTWSERHAAYACGLGTFGLSDGLITPKGQAMRCGSVIARLSLPASRREYEDHHAYCLFFSQGTCGICIQRCPAGAITPSGHDKLKCQGYSRAVLRGYIKNHYGIDGYGCGLCQTAVPCESKIPLAEDLAHHAALHPGPAR